MKIASKHARSTSNASSLKSLSTLALAVIGALYGASSAWAAPILGSNLASFAVLGATAVTNVPTSTIGGNVGVWAGSSIDGGITFTSGSLQTTTPLAQSAQGQLDTAIGDLNGMANTGGTIGPDLVDLILAPGVYDVGAGLLSGALVLDGNDDINAVWVFRFSSSFTTNVGSSVTVQNVGTGAGVGVYWNVHDLATLNGNVFAGNVLAGTSITSDGGLTIGCGRLLAATGNVVLNQDTISITGCNNTSGGFDQGVAIGSGGTGGSNGQTVPEPATLALLGLGLAGLGFSRRRHG